MGKRNMTLSEKKVVHEADPNIDVDKYIMYQKHKDHYILRDKETREKKRVNISF